MPTGYTADVQDGKITEFRDFLMQCARAFGACISLRDEPLDASIPDEFKPSPHHAERLTEAKADLARLEAMTDRDIARAADAEFEAAHERWRKRRAERQTHRERYEAMLAKAQAWAPPTADHQGIKDFMVKQLTESIDFDCNGGSYDTEPIRRTEAQWKADATNRERESIAYHEKEYAAEVERARSRTEWVRALRNSVQ